MVQTAVPRQAAIVGFPPAQPHQARIVAWTPSGFTARRPSAINKNCAAQTSLSLI
jgi:hypothetical protein